MAEYDLRASTAWYSTDELYDTDQDERKEMLQRVHDDILDGADVESAVMTAFLLGASEGVARTVDEHDLEVRSPDL